MTCMAERCCGFFHLLRLSRVEGQLSQGPGRFPLGHAAWRTSLEAETPLPGFIALPQTALGHECNSVFMGVLDYRWTYKPQSRSVSVPEENAAETCPKVQSFINILTLCDESTLNIDW